MTDRKQISYMQERNARLAIQKILIEEVLDALNIVVF